MEGLVGEIPARRLRHPRAVEPQPSPRQRPRPRRQQGGRGGAPDRRDRPLSPRSSSTPTGSRRRTSADFLDGLDVVVEECDSLDMKFLVREAARERAHPGDHGDERPRRARRRALRPRPGPADLPRAPGRHGLDEAGGPEHGGEGAVRHAARSARARRPSRGAASLLGGGPDDHRMAPARQRGHARGGDGRRGGPAHRPGRRAAVGRDALRRRGDPRGPRARSRSTSRPRSTSVTPPPSDPPLVSDDPIELIVDAARRAPSGGNIQPWRFEADDDEIRFYMVPERTSAMDVGHRGSYVALGAALFNARVEAASLQRLGPVKLFPEGATSHHVATMLLGDRRRRRRSRRCRDYLHVGSANRRIGTPDGRSIPTTWSGALARASSARAPNCASSPIEARSPSARSCSPRRTASASSFPTSTNRCVASCRWPGPRLARRGTRRPHPGDGPGELRRHGAARRGPTSWPTWPTGGPGRVLGMRTQAAVDDELGARADDGAPRRTRRGTCAAARRWSGSGSAPRCSGLAVQPAAPVFIYAVDEDDLRNLAGERYLDESPRPVRAVP